MLLDRQEYIIHDNAIGIMSFFEIYCNANRCCPQTIFSKQLGTYLQHLREGIGLHRAEVHKPAKITSPHMAATVPKAMGS